MQDSAGQQMGGPVGSPEPAMPAAAEAPALGQQPTGGSEPAMVVSVKEQAKQLKEQYVHKLRMKTQGTAQQQLQQHTTQSQPASHNSAVQQRQQQQQQQQQQQGQDSSAPPTAPLEQATLPVRQGPLYAAAPHGRGQPSPTAGYLHTHYANFDAAALVQAEYQQMKQRRLKERAAELQAVVADPGADPGMSHRREQLPLGAALLQLRMLRMLGRQAELRAAVEAEGREIASMSDKQYRMLFRTQRMQRIEAARKDIAARAELASVRARDAKAYRSEMMAEHAIASRDLRVARNRLVTRTHERLARERNKLKDDDRTLRLEALKAHDFEAYQEMLRRQTGGLPAAGERYEAISKFLEDTEAYLHRLAGKIAAVKVSAEASSAAARAIADARAKGMSEEEVQAAARAAATEAATGSEALRAAAEVAGDAQSRYYALAHSNQEEIVDQPTLLRPPGGARLREYQIVGLQWMVSLYNNHLNGILADEMGLGKTVQVMALVAYLMEKKANYGPHLIIVPNAVMVNWKAELTQWLPAARCVYYVGGKEERTRKYVAEVQPLQFNILVTTYEFIMRDRAKLSKIEWQYIVIDEAQRMKDRQSKLAKDLDRFTAARRLLLSGTPLQNDLIELWSLLNLLLPDVFDDKKVFAEWFGDSVGGGPGKDDWLAKEKRVVVIHRLHQILEPFMLRRQVEDVESKLPPKTAFTVRCPMSAHQSAVYSWVKATGTLRLDPAAPQAGKAHREYASLQNKCMELRKVCNHPLLSYPFASLHIGDAIVRQCGKLAVLDRMLVKLKAAGHRVLLFSTMTKLLDMMEVYLQWRQLPESAGGGRMRYLRIDGSTSLEDRETAIQRFNAPASDAFIFLLSIRAAGRGLNLQSSDTVIIYDPDPNPKNEEQAIARSHRIGQSKEVRVFHLEAVADASTQAVEAAAAEDAAKEAAAAEGGAVRAENAAAVAAVKAEGGTVTVASAPATPPPRRLYADSIESIVRGQIQRIKIEMANEVIDAGRFDQQTTMEERRHTLEALLQDQDAAQAAVNAAATPAEMNAMLARGAEELELFERLDATCGWFDVTRPEEVPAWMRYNEAGLRDALELSSKHKVDVEAEIAALTGTVLHHHHVAAEGEAAAARAAVAEAKAKAAAAAVAERAEPAAPTLTMTTTRSSLGGGEEEEEVAMEDNDEEEEVLEQNLVTEDLTEGATASAAAGGVPRVASTAATAAPMDGGGGVPAGLDGPGGGADAAANGGGDAEDGNGSAPAAKRRRFLSVHFEEDLERAGEAEMPQAPPEQQRQE